MQPTPIETIDIGSEDNAVVEVKLSICVPTFNRALLLEECLSSVCLSRRGFEKDVEIVISDNYSPDETGIVAKRFVDEYANIRYYINDGNIGGERNFYRAAQRASGKFIWLFCDDDKMERNAIASVIAAIDAGHNLIVCNYSVWTMDFYLKKKSFGLSTRKKKVFTCPNELMDAFGLNLGYLTSVAIKKDIFFSVSFDSYVRFEEYGLCFMYTVYAGIIKCCNAVFISEPVVLNRSGNSGGYDWFKYYVIGGSLIFDELHKAGYTIDAVASAKYRVLKELVIPQLFFMKLDNDSNLRDILRLILPYYKKKWVFWVKGIPIMLIPPVLVRSAKKMVEVKRQLLRLISSPNAQ